VATTKENLPEVSQPGNTEPRDKQQVLMAMLEPLDTALPVASNFFKYDS
jgi:hypothetical protein